MADANLEVSIHVTKPIPAVVEYQTLLTDEGLVVAANPELHVQHFINESLTSFLNGLGYEVIAKTWRDDQRAGDMFAITIRPKGGE